MAKFGLELHPVKTRLFEFGRFAAERRKQRGEGCPEAFNFLGLTHICGTNRKTGYFTIIRQTISKRRAAKLKQINAELNQRLHDPLAATAKWLQTVVRGYFQYHAVPGNEKSLGQFRSHVLRLWLRQIRRRSQRSCWTWKRFLERLGGHPVVPSDRHPYRDRSWKRRTQPRNTYSIPASLLLGEMGSRLLCLGVRSAGRSVGSPSVW